MTSPSPNEALQEALEKIMPIRVHNGPDYAEVYFADGSTHSTQAMTMNPDDWTAINDAFAALSPSPASSPAGEDVIALVIAAREAWEVDCVSGDDLDKALEPFAALVPYENEPDREALSPLSGEPAQAGDRLSEGRAVELMRAYFAAEDARNDCPECENEGQWEHCGPCSVRIGDAINDQLLFLAGRDGEGLPQFAENAKCSTGAENAQVGPDHTEDAHEKVTVEPASVAGEATAFERLKYYPDYIDDPDGLERLRQDVKSNGGHEMAAVNHNTLGRLIDTIERLRNEAALSKPTPVEAGLREDNRKMRQALDLISTWSPNTGGRLFPVATAQAAIAALSETPPPPSQEAEKA